MDKHMINASNNEYNAINSSFHIYENCWKTNTFQTHSLQNTPSSALEVKHKNLQYLDKN